MFQEIEVEKKLNFVDVKVKEMINPITFMQLFYLCGNYMTNLKHYKIRVGDFHQYVSTGLSVDVDTIIQFLDEMVTAGFLELFKGNENSPVNIVYKRYEQKYL